MTDLSVIVNFAMTGGFHMNVTGTDGLVELGGMRRCWRKRGSLTSPHVRGVHLLAPPRQRSSAFKGAALWHQMLRLAHSRGHAAIELCTRRPLVDTVGAAGGGHLAWRQARLKLAATKA